MRHYSDYFHVKEDYCPNMTREEINQTPERSEERRVGKEC